MTDKGYRYLFIVFSSNYDMIVKYNMAEQIWVKKRPKTENNTK